MRALAVLVVLATVLAGCSAKPGSFPSPSSSATTTVATANPPMSAMPTASTPSASSGPTFTLDSCRNFGGVFPVPLASAKSVLPQGFEPVPASTDPTGATLYILGLKCDGSTVQGVAQGAADLLYAELAVVPSTAYAVPGISDYTVPVFFTTANAALAEELALLHLGAAGAGKADWVEHTGAGDVIVAASLGSASLTLRGAVSPAPPASLSSGKFVTFGVQDGAVKAVLAGDSAGGSAADAAVTLQATAAPAPVGDARPATRGFSVSGFTLTFAARPLPP